MDLGSVGKDSCRLSQVVPRIADISVNKVAMSQIILLSLISPFVLYVWATVGSPGIVFLEPFVAACFSIVQGVNTLGVNILPCPAVCECIVSMCHCFQLLIDLAQKSL